MALHLNHHGKNRKAKGSQPLLQLESLTRWKLGSKRRTSGASESRMTSGSGEQGNFEDPYTFIDSQSLQPEPPRTPLTHQQGEGGAGRAGKARTPQSRKKQQRSPLWKSPAEIKDEQLRQREEEDLERALEESRREMAKVERRQRQQRRGEKEEAVERMGMSQDSPRQVEEILNPQVLGTVLAAQTVTEGSSTTEHDKVPTSTDQVIVNDDIGDLTDDLSQCTPPLNGVPSNTTTPHSRLSSVCRTPIVKVKKLLHSPFSGGSIAAQKVVPPGGQEVWSGGVEWGWGEERGREGRLSETPPLVGDEVVVEAEEEVELVEGGGMEGEAGCEGEGVEREKEGGFNNVPLNANGSSEYSTKKGDAIDAPVQSSLVTHCDSNSQQPSHLLHKRHSLLLSLRKGKKRLSTTFRTDERDPSPSSKKTRLSLHQSTDTTTTERVEEEGHRVSDIGPSVAASRAKKTRSDQSERATKTKLPELFAPEGVNPATYTATILRRFNSYIHQLRLAQAKITTRVPWSQPVAVYHRQPPHTLDYRYCQLRHSSRKVAITNGWPTIDLNTGQVTHLTPKAKSTIKHLSTRSSKRHARLSCETDDSSMSHHPTPPTPVRAHHSQKRKNLCEDICEEQQAVVDQPLLHGNSISAAAHSTTPDPPQVSVDTTPTESDLTPESHDTNALSDPGTDGTTAFDLPSSSTAVVPPTVELDRRNQVDGNLAGEFGGERRPDRTQEMPGWTTSSVETSEVIEVPRSLKRRRTARFLDDSDSDTDPAVDRPFDTCGNSKYSTSSDVIGTKNRTVGEVEDKVPVEVNQQKSVSPYASALAAFGRGKRLKRVSLGPKYGTSNQPDHSTSHRQPDQNTSRGSSDDVIDLTEDVPSVSNELPASQESRGREEEMVPCPLCAELFTVSAVEAHAASCLEPQVPSPQPQRSTEKAHPVKQMSLLALRLNKTNVPLPSSHSESLAGWCAAESHGAGYSEEEDEGREGEGDEEGEGEGEGAGTPSSDQERVDSGPQVYECEGGGYQVDPATISSSPIRTFRRITDLDPQERAGYYNQFSKKRRGGRGGRGSGGGDATWGRAEFSEMMEYTSARKGGRGKGKSSRRGRGQGGRGRGRGKWRPFRGRGKRSK